MKPISVGISDFAELVRDGYYYIDKSMLIKDVIMDAKCVLMPRPRRFGKSLNMSMLKYFFQKPIKENRKAFPDYRYLFKGLKIAKDPCFKKHQGKYPVIYFSFLDIKCNTFEETFEKIKQLIINEYKKHIYLRQGDFLNEYDKKDFDEIVKGKASKVMYEYSLTKLMEYLERYHNKQVIIIVDEYDTPINSLYVSYQKAKQELDDNDVKEEEGRLRKLMNQSKDDYNNIINFTRNLFIAALKDNPNLSKGILTGIFRISKESIFTGLNNLEVHSLIDPHKMEDKFGFTEEEVHKMLDDYNLSDKKEEVRDWYDGYKFGKTEIYNPWSILEYIKNNEKGFKIYWANTSDNQLIKKTIKNAEEDASVDLARIINKEEVLKEINEHVVFEEMYQESGIWSFLVAAGYLKAEKINEDDYRLSVPNREIQKLYEMVIKEWVKPTSEVTMHLLNYLLQDQREKFEKGLRKRVEDIFSIYDIAKEKRDNESKTPERVYHAFMIGLLSFIQDTHLIRSNRESGKGRYDLMIMPIDKNKKGIIIEIKSIGDEDDHEEELEEALNQIEDKKYDQELKSQGVIDIVKLAIVFCGKQLWLRYA